MERAIVEAIDALVAPAVRTRIVELALRWARRTSVPERGPEVEEFVNGPLRAALEATAGEQVALAVNEELATLVAVVADAEVSSVRSSWPAPGSEPEITVGAWDDLEDPREDPPAGPPFPTEPAPQCDLPLVLVASYDPTTVARLGAALAGLAFLEPVSDALGVLDGLDRHPTSVIVLDCRRPSIAAETLLAIEPELPAGARVVLWGETPALERALGRLGAGIPQGWVRCGAGAQPEDVAAVCRVLLA